jgi:hypothetical protein
MVYASGNREWEAAWVGDNPKWDSRRYSGKASAWLNLTQNGSTNIPDTLNLRLSVGCNTQGPAFFYQCIRVNRFEFKISVNGTPWKVLTVQGNATGDIGFDLKKDPLPQNFSSNGALTIRVDITKIYVQTRKTGGSYYGFEEIVQNMNPFQVVLLSYNPSETTTPVPAPPPPTTTPKLYLNIFYYPI